MSSASTATSPAAIAEQMVELFPARAVELGQALLRTDRAAAEALIASGVEINRPGTRGLRLLHGLVRSGHLDAVALAIELGADPNCVSDGGDTPLYYAAAMDGGLAMLRLLVHRGADIKLASRYTNFQRELTIETLVLRRSSVTFRYKPQMAAAYWWILENGGDINRTELPVCHTSLYWAYMTESFEMTCELLDRGANPYIGSALQRSVMDVYEQRRGKPRPELDKNLGYLRAHAKLESLRGNETLIREAAAADEEFAKLQEAYAQSPRGQAEAAMKEELKRIEATLKQRGGDFKLRPAP